MPLQYNEIKSKTPTKKLVVLLHGYGSNSEDLISLAPDFMDILPDANFISPNAPLNFEGGGWGAYQWYSLADRSDVAMYKGASAASEILVQFIDAQLERLNLSYDAVILAGFSQGGMMTIHNALRFPKKILAAISFSGYLSGENYLANEIKSRPPLFLTHGTEDTIVPYFALKHSIDKLHKHGVDAKSYSAKGLSHGIDIGCIRAAKTFLKEIVTVSK